MVSSIFSATRIILAGPMFGNQNISKKMSRAQVSSLLYDNEAIGSYVLEQSVRLLGEISLAKTILILPILLHDPIVKRFLTASKYRSIDEFIVKERINIGDVNGRVQNMLPLTINCISILLDLKLIEQVGTKLKVVSQIGIDNEDSKIGERCKKIKKVLPKAAFLFEESDPSTYLKFNVLI